VGLVVSDILHLSFIAAVSSSAVTMPVAAVSSSTLFSFYILALLVLLLFSTAPV
jgi:hypothetical protein